MNPVILPVKDGLRRIHFPTTRAMMNPVILPLKDGLRRIHFPTRRAISSKPHFEPTARPLPKVIPKVRPFTRVGPLPPREWLRGTYSVSLGYCHLPSSRFPQGMTENGRAIGRSGRKELQLSGTMANRQELIDARWSTRKVHRSPAGWDCEPGVKGGRRE